MPLIKKTAAGPDPRVEDFCRRLVEEWKNPRQDAPQPLIIEEEERRGATVHVYVIWDEWADLDQLERSEIILNALEQVYGIKKSADVTIALGLTAKEAAKMGIGGD